MTNKKTWDNTYTKFKNDLPWNLQEIPLWFKKPIKSWVQPCKTLDIGCGLGNYAKYLSEQKFDVLGIDYSKKAISLAKKLYPKINFQVLNALNLNKLKQKFDFIYEVSLLHHIKPADRNKYSQEIYNSLNKNGKFLLCCFSDKENFFKGNKQFNNPETKTITYPLSREEIIKIFSPHLILESIKEIQFGKHEKRKRYLCLMSKK